MGFKYELGAFAENAELLEEYKRQFLEKEYVVIPDFLSDDSAHALHKWLTEDMPKDWWHWSRRNVNIPSSTELQSSDGYYEARRNLKDPQQQRQLNYHHHVVTEALNEKQYAFSFSRTGAHHEECSCLECLFWHFLWSDAAHHPLEFITDSDLSLETMFSSLYEAGDFLMPHNDHPHGQISCSFQLTKEWHPAWGGQYQILDSVEQGNPIFSTLPNFNTALIFRSSLQHQVTYVPDSVQAERTGLTLWYKNNSLKSS